VKSPSTPTDLYLLTLAHFRGLEADQKVIAAHGCYAMTATTALTAQNTQGVQGVHEVPPPFLRKQIEACLNDIGADVIKTGEHASTGLE
jgi:hydroxymethylpyrimidine/phosphomethylpyrimidine kinase